MPRHSARTALLASALFFAGVLPCLHPVYSADLARRTLLLDVAFAGNAIVSVGERGVILRSTDQGATWAECRSGTTAPLTAVAFANERVGWAVGHDGLVLHSTDGGASWNRQWQSENLSDSFLDVVALDAKVVIAVGAYGLYAGTTDGGATWETRRITEEDYHLNRISRGPSGTLYMAGEHGTLMKSTDAGRNWMRIAAPYGGSFYGILPLGPTTLLAHGLRGRVYRSDNDGANWTAVPTDETALLATAVKLRQGPVVLAGQARAFLVSRDARTGFSRRDAGVSSGIAELLELPNGHLLAVGEAGISLLGPEQVASLSTDRAAEPR